LARDLLGRTDRLTRGYNLLLQRLGIAAHLPAIIVVMTNKG
jgi:hypothetical protein